MAIERRRKAGTCDDLHCCGVNRRLTFPLGSRCDVDERSARQEYRTRYRIDDDNDWLLL